MYTHTLNRSPFRLWAPGVEGKRKLTTLECLDPREGVWQSYDLKAHKNLEPSHVTRYVCHRLYYTIAYVCTCTYTHTHIYI